MRLLLLPAVLPIFACGHHDVHVASEASPPVATPLTSEPSVTEPAAEATPQSASQATLDPTPGQAPERAPGVTELSSRELDARGDEHLREGRFTEAVADFDAAIAKEPRLEPYHWRRGIAHYYAGAYADGAAQFELHRTVNGNDVENAAWHFLCVARSDSPEAARAAMLPVGPDRRVPMTEVYEMFAGRMTPEQVLAAAGAVQGARQAEPALFYGHLYVGLYYEATGNPALAKTHIDAAATEFTSAHYMGDVARVHAKTLRE